MAEWWMNAGVNASIAMTVARQASKIARKLLSSHIGHAHIAIIIVAKVLFLSSQNEHFWACTQ